MKTISYDSNAIFIGLMSGTSIDAIDAAAVSFTKQGVHIHQTHSHKITKETKELIIELNTPSENELHKTLQLDEQLGELFSEAVLVLLEKAKLSHSEISAIGSHGQTIRHQIKSHPFYTLQIGNPNIIAEKTGICTVADFRTRDMVIGGQGAPLVPAFHQAIFQSNKDRVIINIGGMANLTLLWADHRCQGFDTGPGNVLMDMWIYDNKGLTLDKDGAWAKTGNINNALLHSLLNEKFLSQKPPKSTGRDLFNKVWLKEKLQNFSDSPENIQATLLAFTAESIARAIEQWGPSGANFSGSGFSGCEVYLCGGGAHNEFLFQTLQQRLKNHKLASTKELGLEPDWVEACAFAWLAKQTLEGKPGNLASVTGAAKNTILGAIYPANTT